MQKKRRVFAGLLSMVLALSLFGTEAYAAEKGTIETIAVELRNLAFVEYDEEGGEFLTSYVIRSEEDIYALAEQIYANGWDWFYKEVHTQLQEELQKETPLSLPGVIESGGEIQSTSPSSQTLVVSGNGTHPLVSDPAYGLVSFPSVGTAEYTIILRYSVIVAGGVMTQIVDGSPNASFPAKSANTVITEKTYQKYCYSTQCGVTANYKITKSIQISIGVIPIEIRSETVRDFFALLAHL